MKGEQPKTKDEMRMSTKEFDRIMHQALNVKPDKEKSAPAERKVAAKRKKPET